MLCKCQYCGLKDTNRELLTKDKKGYYHPACHEKFISAKGAVEQDRKELDELTLTLKRIHDMQVIPSPFYIRLGDLRHGTAVRKVKGKGRREVRQKKGVSYSLINETYLYSERKIMDMKKVKRFNNDMSELNYCLAIVIGNINDVYKRRRNQSQADVMQLSTQDIEAHVEHRSNVIPMKRKRKDAGDITDFLDE